MAQLGKPEFNEAWDAAVRRTAKALTELAVAIGKSSQAASVLNNRSLLFQYSTKARTDGQTHDSTSDSDSGANSVGGVGGQGIEK